MSKVTIITEKPSAGKNFAKALGGMSGKLSDGNSYEIVCAVGHLFGLADIHDQVPVAEKDKYKKWTWDTIPFDPNEFKFKLKQKPKTANVLKSIKQSCLDADEVVCATDVDPSGEGGLIFAEIIESIRYKRKLSRCYHVDESVPELQKAIANRKPIVSLYTWDEYLKADARQKFDFLSISWTRMTTLAAGDVGKRAVTRQGRLKSVMVRFVGEQLDKVNSYVKKPYYEAVYVDENRHIYRRSPASADRKENKNEVDLSQFPASAVIVDKTEIKSTAPSKLLDLASLSGILSSRGYKPKSVLSCYQKMYENQVVSYPRTDDKVITLEQYNELLKNIDKIADCVGVDKSLLTHRQPRKQHIGNGSHGANRPGPNIPDSLDDVEKEYGKLRRAIYQILAKQCLAIFAEDYKYEHQTGHIEKNPEFVGSANIPVDMGFKAVFDTQAEVSDKKSKDEDPDKDGRERLPLGINATSKIKEGSNPKPSWPTVKWLVKQLEKYDVGTGATRTSTISEITSETKTQLMEESKGKLSLTYVGNISYVLIKDTMMSSVETTEQLFKDMKQVGAGALSMDIVLDKVRQIFDNDVSIVKHNASDLMEAGNMQEFKPKEKIEGVYTPTGETIKFNKQWSDHEFTEDEAQKLLSGDAIEFESVNKRGKTYIAKGRLQKGSFKRHEFWGFQLEFDKSVPDRFCEHDFTDEEKAKLENREAIFRDDWISKKRSSFPATVRFKDGKFNMSFD